MEYIYAVLLLHHGKQPITEENIIKVLQAAGISPDDIRVKALVAAVKQINIDEVIRSAAVMPVVPTAAPSAAPSAPAPAPEKAERKVEVKAEEKKAEKKEVSEEEIAAGLAGLFG